MAVVSEKRGSTTTSRTPLVRWTVVPHTPALVLVGYCGEEPAAIIERDAGQRYRLVSCRGAELGSFDTISEAQSSFERELRG
ncbi:MAG: hypothetical protein RJQ01_07280 [Microcella sp.]|uniref:hypothetical protein n=1 Tax=Microcella sp. TaxID=1913979 RepID=UPI0033163B86